MSINRNGVIYHEGNEAIEQWRKFKEAFDAELAAKEARRAELAHNITMHREPILEILHAAELQQTVGDILTANQGECPDWHVVHAISALGRLGFVSMQGSFVVLKPGLPNQAAQA